MTGIERELIVMLTAVFGSGLISTMVVIRANRRKLSAEVDSIQTSTVATLEPIVSAWLDRLKERVVELEEEVNRLTVELRSETRRRRAYETALLENEIQVPRVDT